MQSNIPGSQDTKFAVNKLVRTIWHLLILFCCGCSSDRITFDLSEGQTIVFVGNTFAEGFQRHNYFETLLHQSFPDHQLIVRNLGWSADEVNLMPRPLNFPSLDDHLLSLRADVIILSFGLNESYQGEAGLDDFKAHLEEFIRHLQSRNYNDLSPPRVILLSPLPFEQLDKHLPAEFPINSNLQLYSQSMNEVAIMTGVDFIDLYRPVLKKMKQSSLPLTSNGIHLNDRGRILVAEYLARTLDFSQKTWESSSGSDQLRRAINEKNNHFFFTYRPANSEYIIGRPKDWPGGQELHGELERTRNITARLDSLIWECSKSPQAIDLSTLKKLIRVGEGRPATVADRTMYPPDKSQFILKPGYEIELFASEQDFPIGNPVAMTFDGRGRLWLAVMPSYPNYYPGDPPNDQLIILENLDQDGKADTHIVFADSLYLPLGFELDGKGVYLTQAPDMLYLRDTTGDDVADTKEYILHGFGTEDAHHSLSANTWGPDGALYMHMGTFLYSQVETPYGPQRGAYGTTWRYDPVKRKLDNYISYPYANPWGNVFNQYGDHFIADASTGRCHFGTPLSTCIDYPVKHTSQKGFLTAQYAPKTCGMEIISSHNFPADVQGDILVNTFVGFQGVRQHRLLPDSSQYTAMETEPLLQSKDPNFRPVDLKFGPDTALYVLDWFNPIVQHGEQGFREEQRDHTHGRIWRIKYSENPLNEVRDYSKTSLGDLLESLLKATDREKYRIRTQLRNFTPDEMSGALNQWLSEKGPEDPDQEYAQLEALWINHRMDYFYEGLLEKVLKSENEQIRAAAVKVMHWWKDYVKDYPLKLHRLAEDKSFKVRLETAVALSHEKKEDGVKGLLKILNQPIDKHISYVLKEALMNLQTVWIKMLTQDPDFLMDDLVAANFLFDLLEDAELLSLPGFISNDPDWEKFTWQKPSERTYANLQVSNAFQIYSGRSVVAVVSENIQPADSDDVVRIVLGTVLSKMIYEQATLCIGAGEKVIIEFQNDDNMV